MYKNYQDERIDVESKQLYVNSTFLYLRPQIYLFDEVFNYNFNSTWWLGFGINDYMHYHQDLNYENYMFMLCRVGPTSTYFRENFETYTVFDDDLNKMMIKVELPINNRSAFLEGRYSELYDKQQIQKLFYPRRKVRSPVNPHVYVTSKSWGVINKLPERKLSFSKQLKEDFGVNVTVDDSFELEYPPFINREVFNYDCTQQFNQVQTEREYI